MQDTRRRGRKDQEFPSCAHERDAHRIKERVCVARYRHTRKNVKERKRRSYPRTQENEVNPKSWTKNLIKLLVNEFCTLQDSFLLIYEIFSRCCSSKYIRVNSQ